MNQINDLELAVRTIENLLSDMPTKSIEKWLAILTTATIKCQDELNSTLMHHCTACSFEEYGYRTELPIFWQQKDEVIICFNHNEIEVAGWLAMKQDVSAVNITDPDQTIEELMALI